MIIIPLYILLVGYLIFLAIFFIFSLANVYHIYSTGTFTFTSLSVTLLVAIWCLGVLGITFLSLMDINWTMNIVFLGPGGLISFQ